MKSSWLLVFICKRFLGIILIMFGLTILSFSIGIGDYKKVLNIVGIVFSLIICIVGFCVVINDLIQIRSRRQNRDPDKLGRSEK